VLLLGTAAASKRRTTTPPVTGSFAWFDASDLASLTVSGGFVSQWRDKSGNARHLNQATGANQPGSGTRTINSRNALDFDGSNDAMATATLTLAQPLTVYCVAQTDAFFGVHIVGNNAGSPTVYINAASGNPEYGYYAGSLEVQNTAFTNVDANPHVWATVFNGASSAQWIDGVSTGATGNPGTNGWAGIAIWVGNNPALAAPWDGLIAELLFYSGAHSTANRQSTEAWLKARWGTP
jgi:hypothetical protein